MQALRREASLTGTPSLEEVCSAIARYQHGLILDRARSVSAMGTDTKEQREARTKALKALREGSYWDRYAAALVDSWDHH